MTIDPNWWKSAVFYQIYPRSFRDANNDGIGDLQGVTEKLDYLNDGKGGGLGIDAIWFSPFFTSPMADFGYDVSDYCDIDPMFGTLADFDKLVAEAHQRGIKIVLDLVLNHSSDQHPWFQESRQDRSNPKADWYVWVDPKPDGSLPNNWLSVFGGPAWTFDEQRGQWYMHSFLREQPDLNWYHPEVREALFEVVRFWVQRGTDGFRFDTANFFAYDQQFRDNPRKPDDLAHLETDKSSNPFFHYISCYSKDRPENFDFIAMLRKVLDEGTHLTSIGEVGGSHDLEGTIKMTADYANGPERLHMAYSFALLNDLVDHDYFATAVALTEKHSGEGWPCWSLGNHDCTRLFSRLGCAEKPEYQQMLLGLLLTLRGTPILYYGDELDMPEYPIRKDQLQDPYGIRMWPEIVGRDGCRTPFPWSSSATQQGFNSGAKPWLPATAPNTLEDAEQEDRSTLQAVRGLLRIRKSSPALQTGSFQVVSTENDCYVFERKSGSETMLVAGNFSGKERMTALSADLVEDCTPKSLAQAGRVENGKLHLPGYGFFIGRLT